MTQDNPSSQQQAGWQNELAALLAEIEAATTPADEARVFGRVAALDPDLQLFLLEHMAAQATPEAAAFLAALAAHPHTPPAVSARARAEPDTLAARDILPPAPGVETFHAGWLQEGRERGEQIMILGWRLPDGRMEALVFLLDWRGDGLKDFYRTREVSPAEWRELLEHNGAKGAPLVEITLAEGRALLEDALAEGQRFSRPAPREYKLAQDVVNQRVAQATDLPTTRRSHITPTLAPEEVVAAYVRALHHRDYALVYELLAPDHSTRAQPRAAAIEALRREWKPMPRRRPDAKATLEAPSAATAARRDDASVLAEGQAETVERTGRRVRTTVRERYHLRRTPEGWRISGVETL